MTIVQLWLNRKFRYKNKRENDEDCKDKQYCPARLVLGNLPQNMTSPSWNSMLELVGGSDGRVMLRTYWSAEFLSVYERPTPTAYTLDLGHNRRSCDDMRCKFIIEDEEGNNILSRSKH